jgi:hypothetical protein
LQRHHKRCYSLTKAPRPDMRERRGIHGLMLQPLEFWAIFWQSLEPQVHGCSGVAPLLVAAQSLFNTTMTPLQ